jgi:hypothetical protein
VPRNPSAELSHSAPHPRFNVSDEVLLKARKIMIRRWLRVDSCQSLRDPSMIIGRTRPATRHAADQLQAGECPLVVSNADDASVERLP